jgi:hypothetical protein
VSVSLDAKLEAIILKKVEVGLYSDTEVKS